MVIVYDSKYILDDSFRSYRLIKSLCIHCEKDIPHIIDIISTYAHEHEIFACLAILLGSLIIGFLNLVKS